MFFWSHFNEIGIFESDPFHLKDNSICFAVGSYDVRLRTVHLVG